MAGKQATFWLAVAGVSILTPVVLNVAADRLEGVPAATGFVDLVHYITRKNG